MDLHVINRNLGVGHIRINGVTTSSLVIIGDADAIQLSSTFDTPQDIPPAVLLFYSSSTFPASKK
ncbi:MAG TPA: spore gernimation protein GerPD [Bacillaceae bacterium]